MMRGFIPPPPPPSPPPLPLRLLLRSAATSQSLRCIAALERFIVCRLSPEWLFRAGRFVRVHTVESVPSPSV